MKTAKCFRCDYEVNEEDLSFSEILNDGTCSSCRKLNKKIEILRAMASSLREGRLIELDVSYTDIFPVGNSVVQTKLVFDATGHAFIYPESDEGEELDWFEWGQELYIGPKSYNKFEQHRIYKKLLLEMNIEDHEFQHFKEMTDYEREFEGHSLAEQEIGLVFTAGESGKASVDRWLSVWVGPRPNSEDLSSATPFYGHWHVHELNRLFKLFKLSEIWFEDENEHPRSKSEGIADELEGWAHMLEKTDRHVISYFNVGYWYNEERVPRLL